MVVVRVCRRAERGTRTLVGEVEIDREPTPRANLARRSSELGAATSTTHPHPPFHNAGRVLPSCRSLASGGCLVLATWGSSRLRPLYTIGSPEPRLRPESPWSAAGPADCAARR